MNVSIRMRLPVLSGVMALAAVVGASTAGGADGPRRHVETAGGFSFVPPEGWVVRDFPGLKYKVVIGPVNDRFAANINLVVENHAGSLDDYVEANVKALQQAIKGFKLIERDDLKTADGLPVARLITESEQNDRLLRQVFYFFGRGQDKFVATCSVARATGAALDQEFEKTMKTFRIEKKPAS